MLLKIEESPFFVFCAGFFLYIAGSFLIMLLVTNLSSSNRALLDSLWSYVHDALNIVKNASIAFCLHLYAKKQEDGVR